MDRPPTQAWFGRTPIGQRLPAGRGLTLEDVAAQENIRASYATRLIRPGLNESHVIGCGFSSSTLDPRIQSQQAAVAATMRVDVRHSKRSQVIVQESARRVHLEADRPEVIKARIDSLSRGLEIRYR